MTKKQKSERHQVILAGIVGGACLIIGFALAWYLRPPITVTKTEYRDVIKTVVKKEFVDRYIVRIYDKDTGKIISETITDKSKIDTDATIKERIVEKIVEKPFGTTFIITAGCSITKGVWYGGAGITLFNRIDIQAINPVALTFEPTALLSLRF